MRVDEMEAGLRLDALVATTVMGMTIAEVEEFNEWEYALANGSGNIKRMTKEQKKRRFWHTVKKANGKSIEAYSTDIAAAWQIVERLDELPDNLDQRATKLIRSARPISANHQHCCIITDHDRYGMPCAEWRGYGATAPHAICLAALRACGVEEVEDVG